MDPWILIAYIAATLLGVVVLIWVACELFAAHMFAVVARGELEPEDDESEDD
jgi:hypothetical protein